MRQIIRIPDKRMIPNPHYSKEVAKMQTNPPYTVPDEIEDIKYTTITIEGVPNVVVAVSDFIFKTFEVE